MIMKFPFHLMLFLLLISLQCKAGFCPTNFRTINNGDSIASVLQNCGNPSSQKTTSVPIEPPQQWDYFVHQTVAGSPLYTTTGTLKMSVAFDANGKAINISVNGIGVGATAVCDNKPIQLGSTRDQVKTNCGVPFNVNKQTLGGPQSNQITVYTYSTNPPKSLTFKNGQLVGQ